MQNELIRFDQVHLRFGDETIFSDLSFAIRAGEFVCLLGPSGCGKSTSLRLMGYLLDSDGGRITIDGKNPSEAWDRLAFVFQSPRLVPWRTAFGNVRLGMELRGCDLKPQEADAKAMQNLELVGLARDTAKYPRMLSGGERQRVALARALAVEPDIILMDEPFSALDPNTRQRLRGEIISVWQKTGKTIVFVTHDIEEALVLADRILLLSNKPTRVIKEVAIAEPRPRSLSTNAILARQREELIDTFKQLENHREEGAPS